ncbi:MAG: prolyl oligopeptidase family serine peptidase [Planctomycetota bacterium]|nr:prolyl oligopeptidase family serine peptidase [Planctomycetota bacterium]
MKPFRPRIALLLGFLGTLVGPLVADDAGHDDAAPGQAMLRQFLEGEVRAISESCLRGIDDLATWSSRRVALRRELKEMLGLEPAPSREDLWPVITGVLDRKDLGIVVEKIHFQSLPGLYVTANLYRPRSFQGKLPAVLYLCGHGRVKIDGVSYGNKVHYQHHPTWFARNGYVCLVIDTLQLGEIEGLHHGTYRLGMWWWVARGYTPAGVEAWNSIRALDYLSARPEVDRERLGVTGRSGGGIGSWWLGALDDRVSAIVPVSGMTDLRNHVLDGCIEGHCDCNFPVNLYRWDFPAVASLSAPRPLLFSNTDKDRIFPLDGVVRVHARLAEIYRLHGKEKQLGLLITAGPHGDTQELRVPAFRWMDRWLRGHPDQPVTMVAEKFFEPRELKVFDALPSDEVNTRIHEIFVPAAPEPKVPATRSGFSELRGLLLARLGERTFRNAPDVAAPLDVELRRIVERGDLRLRVFSFRSEGPFRLPLRVVSRDGGRAGITLRVVGEKDHQELIAALGALFPQQSAQETTPGSAAKALRRRVQNEGTLAFLAPRGIGPSRWGSDPKKLNQIRRRFLALGRTLDEMRVHDVRRAVRLLGSLPEHAGASLALEGEGTLAGVALYAALFEAGVERLHLRSLPASHRDGVVLMNVLQVLDIPQAVALVLPRRVVLTGVDREAFRWTRQAAELLGAELSFEKSFEK